jgi:aldose 1-epimerase
MSFSIESSAENGIGLVLLRDSASGTTAAIAPEFGALLHGFSFQTPAGPVNVIDHYPDRATLEKELGLSFKSSKLSPFACRIPGGRYRYDGQEFEITKKFVDGSAIHGLLYNKAFTEMNRFSDEQQARLQLKYNYRMDDPGYPFKYRCEVNYTLLPDSLLQLQTTVINLDELPIPMADGWHPYFSLGGRANDWLLQFNAAAILEFDEALIPTGKLLPWEAFKEPEKLGGRFLDNCFLLNTATGGAACTLRDPAGGVGISFFPDENYPYLQIYTPDHRRSIAIENLSAAPDAFHNGMGLLMLPAGHTHSFTVHYQLSCH